MAEDWDEGVEQRNRLSRRAVLVRGAGGALGLGALSGLAVPASGLGGTGPVTVGSNASDAVPKAAYGEVYKAFQSSSGASVKVNTVDHNTFQEQINSYLQ